MRRYVEKIEQALPGMELDLCPESYAAVEGLRAIYGRVGGRETLIVDGCKAFQFEGETKSGVKLCPMHHENRMLMNQEFAYTAPQPLGCQDATIGCGDRLGIAGEGQLAAVSEARVRPVLAQQSLRELSLLGRSYDEVIDCASWSVFKTGYKKGFGADGDHLKSESEIEAALEHGVSMITLDCSLVLGNRSKEAGGDWKNLKKEYLEQSLPDGLGLSYTEESLKEVAAVYGGAVELAEKIYRMIREKKRRVDLEISLDETEYTTDIKAHYFVANELYRRGVKINSMAPKFVGEFQKAVDYIGDVEAFRADLKAHVKVADHFGYKISIHSGSDKFRVFPAIAEETGGRFHIKTSGTSWLEAVKVIARMEPALYRDMHRRALETFEKAKAYYVVHADPARIRPLEETIDEDLWRYLEQDDARQLLHITYGYLLREDAELGCRIQEALACHRQQYEQALKAHFIRHLSLLGCI